MLMLMMLPLFTFAAQPESSTVQEVAFSSAVLGEDIHYTVYLPAGYDEQSAYPVLYLLHGRGDDMTAWLNIRADLDKLIAESMIPPLIAVLLDAPWSERANYYVDSAYTGFPKGHPVETAFFEDFIPHIEATYRTLPTREARVIGGYSMGGYGAMRYALAHPDVFSAAIVLSPAVYSPLPPEDSSTREFGAFGKDLELFDDAIYQSLNYPALLPSFDADLKMFVAVGDDEWKNPKPEDFLHDLDMEAHLLYSHLARVETIQAEFRVYDGGHDWNVWTRGFIEGIRWIAPSLAGNP